MVACGRSIALFIAAAIAEIGGAYLVWIGIKDHRGLAFVALGAMALTAYGVIAPFQPSHEFGRVAPRAPAATQAAPASRSAPTAGRGSPDRSWKVHSRPEGDDHIEHVPRAGRPVRGRAATARRGRSAFYQNTRPPVPRARAIRIRCRQRAPDRP